MNNIILKQILADLLNFNTLERNIDDAYDLLCLCNIELDDNISFLFILNFILENWNHFTTNQKIYLFDWFRRSIINYFL